MLAKRKKAVMGIGTLIIFISVILVAAVAAGVIISTAGLLQQKSLVVGEEARKRLVNQLEVISVIAGGNVTDEKVNDFEVLARLGPGSNPIQVRTLGISLLTQTFDTSMTLQRFTMDNYSVEFFADPTAGLSLAAQPGANAHTIDDRDGDGVNDKVWLDNSTGTPLFLVELTNNNAPKNATADPGLNFTAGTPKYIDVEMLIEDNDGNGYGFLLLQGTVNNSNVTNLTTNFTIQEHINECSHEQVPRESRFCFNTKLGNTDTVLDSGEVMEFLFRTKNYNRLGTDDSFEITFYPDKGSLTRINRRTPDVITTNKIFLFP